MDIEFEMRSTLSEKTGMASIKLRDPVHNFIRFDEEEVKVINLDLLQRLRGIRQLAMANLVYPGALHTRFDHTLGVAHVASQMAEELDFDDEEIALVRLASLLHDIGHGPFSHVSEYALDRFANRLTPTSKTICCGTASTRESIMGYSTYTNSNAP